MLIDWAQALRCSAILLPPFNRETSTASNRTAAPEPRPSKQEMLKKVAKPGVQENKVSADVRCYDHDSRDL